MSIQTQSIDTYPVVEAMQISLLRGATVSRRFAIMRSLSQTTIQLSRRAIQRANPNFTQRELDLAFVTLHYGTGLANRLRDYLEQRNDDSD